MCMVFCLHVCLCSTYLQCPRKPGVRFPGTSYSCEPPCECWKMNSYYERGTSALNTLSHLPSRIFKNLITFLEIELSVCLCIAGIWSPWMEPASSDLAASILTS